MRAPIANRMMRLRPVARLAKATAREWLERGVLSREQVHLLLSTSLIALVEQVFTKL